MWNVIIFYEFDKSFTRGSSFDIWVFFSALYRRDTHARNSFEFLFYIFSPARRKFGTR